MKKILLGFLCLVAAMAANAQVSISKVEKVEPNDELFMDMAVSAAQTAVAQGLKPNGAVIIMNGAWKATGLPGAENAPEANAIARSRRTSLPGAVVYTINQPTTAALRAMDAANIDIVYFVNDAAKAIEAGIYSPAEYEGWQDLDLNLELLDLPYAPAAELIK